MGKKMKEHKYNIGDKIVGKYSTIEIMQQTRRGKNNVKSYQYKCLNCTNEDIITEYNLNSKKGCNTCCPNPTSVKENINSIWKVNPQLASLFVNKEESKKYTQCSGAKVLMKCPRCNYIKEYKIATVYARTFSCDQCSDGISYPEKITLSMLRQLKIPVITQLSRHQFSWCENYRYDFYLPTYNAIIEVHGMQHYKDRWIGIEQVQLSDNNKKLVALKNNIQNYVVVDCRYSILDWVKENLIKSLSDLFDMSGVNWKVCDQYATTSNVFTSSELYNKGFNVSEIAEKLNVSKDSVRIWLNKCTKMGICNYDGVYCSKNGSNKAILNTLSNTKYKSISEASRVLNMPRRKLSQMVKDINNREWIEG